MPLPAVERSGTMAVLSNVLQRLRVFDPSGNFADRVSSSLILLLLKSFDIV